MTPTSSNITRIVLTGGPCAGKTTLLARIKEHFSQRGLHVYIVPEAATSVINTGFIPASFSGDHIFELQDAILEITLALYRQTERLIRQLGRYPALVIYDRGTLDAKAYCTPAAWARILAGRNISEAELRDAPYDGIIHLVTAADGARKHYSILNNPARLESWEEAMAIDLRLQAAWARHPRFHVVDNSTSFEGKITRVLEIIQALLPLTDSLSRSFKARNFPVALGDRRAPADTAPPTEVRLQAVLDAATHVSIIAGDPQGRITVFNHGAEQMLGYTAEEMVGKQTPALFHLESEMAARSRELTEEMGRPGGGLQCLHRKGPFRRA
jgi:PAS domain-containing protein